MRNINKFRGCLTGGAAGDALNEKIKKVLPPLTSRQCYI